MSRVTQKDAAADTDLQAVFLAHLDGSAHGLAVPADLNATLRRLLDAGRAAWPDVPLGPELFVRHLAERSATGPDFDWALTEIKAADLYLACACMHRSSGAIARFEEAFTPTIAAFLRHIDRSPAFVDDVRQILLQKLFVAESEGALPKMAGYSGRGSLASWVGVAAQRTGLSLVRGAAAKDRSGGEALAEALPAGIDPELDYLKMRYRTEFREAFQVAFAALPQRERMLLRLSLVKGVSHEKIAAMYQVNQSTVTRWIATARESIASEAQRHLRDRLHVCTEEFHSIGNLVASQLDLSITRWLGDDD